MDGRRDGDFRVSKFDLESASENMDVVDPNLILEVPDTPNRLAVVRTVATSSKTSWEGNSYKLDAKPNCNPARTCVTCSRYSNHHSSVGSGNASVDAEFFFREAKLAQQLSNTAETKPSFQHQSKSQELSCARVSNGIVRNRETINLSSKSPLTDSDPTSFMDPGWKNVESFNEKRMALLPSDVDDMKIGRRHGETDGLRSRDKGKGIDLRGGARIRNSHISSCRERKANFSSKIGSQNVSNSVDRVSDQVNGIGKQPCRDSEHINGQPCREIRLVRNGFISPHRPPLFDGTDYADWKNRMMIHIKAIEIPLWKIIVDGYKPMVDPQDDDKIKEEKLESLNAKAMNILYCGLSKTKYNRISGCETAKAIWQLLEVTHEGTNQVKKIRIAMLVKQYDLFSMLPNESIKEMFTRFGNIINPLKALGKIYPTEELVQKILFSLPSAWNHKTTAIEEANDLSTITFEELMDKLMAYEIQMKSKGQEPSKKTTIAFKDSSDSEDSEEVSDEEMIFIIRKFKSFVKKEKFSRKPSWKNNH